MATLYKHINLKTKEVFYIGIGKTSKRAYSNKDRNRHWKNTVNKYNYKIEILFEDLTWKEACEIEKYLIAYYGRKDLGLGTLVNMTDGGDGLNGYKHNEDTKDKIRIAHLNQSDETRLRRSLAQKGKKLSEETKNKIINNSARSKKVINTETSIIYNSAKELADLLNINYNTLLTKLNLNNKVKNNTQYIYI